MEIEIKNTKELSDALAAGSIISVGPVDLGEALNIHGQVFTPQSGDSHAILYEAIFMPERNPYMPSISGETILNVSPEWHTDPEWEGPRQFVMRRQQVNPINYKKYYIPKLEHFVKDKKYKVIIHPELTAEQIDANAKEQDFGGKTYPEYNCHNFVRAVLGQPHALEPVDSDRKAPSENTPIKSFSCSWLSCLRYCFCCSEPTPNYYNALRD